MVYHDISFLKELITYDMAVFAADIEEQIPERQRGIDAHYVCLVIVQDGYGATHDEIYSLRRRFYSRSDIHTYLLVIEFSEDFALHKYLEGNNEAGAWFEAKALEAREFLVRLEIW